jgi:predicted NACHT family NTPase
MQEIHGHIRVIGTTEPIPIGNIFTDVYILEKPQAYQRFDMSRLQSIQEDPDQLDKLDEVVRERGLKAVISKSGHRLYILGKPGAGKTTFMKYLVQQTILAEELNKLPVFITIRDLDARKTKLFDFIEQQFSICGLRDAKSFIEYLLNSGKALVLFDGLDEMPQEGGQRNSIIHALHDFSKEYLNTQIVITCRVAASDYSFTEFTYIEMADFSPKQITTYARNWFRKDPDKAESFLAELSIDENKGVLDLGSSPLLLSMICLAYDETMTIPKRRAELYEEALDALLKKWDSSRKIKRDQIYYNLSLGHKRQMFARLAAEHFEKGEIFFQKNILARKVESYLRNLPPNSQGVSLDGESILEAISAQHGILVERAHGIYAFAHLTFQEYYTAKYIVENSIQYTLSSLMKHMNDVRWREVFLLTASLLHDATPFFYALQNESFKLISQSQSLLKTQQWTKKRSTKSTVFSSYSKKCLYWYIYLTFSLGNALDHIINILSTLQSATSPYHTKKIKETLDSALIKIRKQDQVLDRVQNLDRILDHALNATLIIQ